MIARIPTIARMTASTRRPGEPPGLPAACTFDSPALPRDVWGASGGRQRPADGGGAPGPPRWLTPQAGPARAPGHQPGTQPQPATMTTRAPSAAGSTAPVPAGLAACGNPAAPTARPAGSRRRRKVAAATPRRRCPARCRPEWRAPAVALCMAIPDTCAAHIGEPASTIIEGAGRRNETESPVSGPGPPTSPGPFRRPAPALRTSRRARGVPSPQPRGPFAVDHQPHPQLGAGATGGPSLNRMLWHHLARRLASTRPAPEIGNLFRACQGLGPPECPVRNSNPAAPCGIHAAAKYGARWRADAGTLAGVRVVITEIAWDGSIRRRALDTSRLTDPGRCDNLIRQVLALPPPYRATPRRPVYVLHASDRAVVMGEDNLIGSLRQLVTTVLAAGDPCLCSTRAGGQKARPRTPDRACDLNGGCGQGTARPSCCIGSMSAPVNLDTQMSSLAACQVPGLVGDPMRPLCGPGEIAGLDQFMCLKCVKAPELGGAGLTAAMA